MIGVKWQENSRMVRHQYSHERLECGASLILAIALAATAPGIPDIPEW